MDYKEAKLLRDKDIYLEHELRAARIVAWIDSEYQIDCELTKQTLFDELISHIILSDEEYESIGLEILERITGVNYEES